MHITRRDSIKEPFEQVPLIFGLIGHRDIRPGDASRLRKEIRDIILEYRAKDKYPETPIVLLTSLAEGADRLGAEVALELGRKSPKGSTTTPEDERLGGIHLVAVLPMPAAAYELDFAGVNSIAEFRRLKGAAQAVWVMSWAKGSPAAGHRPSSQCRNQQYAAAGKFIAVNSHVLIALWDGKGTGLPAGTAFIKDHRDDAIRRAKKRLQKSDPCGYGPFIRIVTPRSGPGGDTGLRGQPFERQPTYPFEDRHPAQAHGTGAHGPGYGQTKSDVPNYEKIYLAIEDFNRQVARVGANVGAGASACARAKYDEAVKGVQKSARYLYPGGTLTSDRRTDLPPAMRWMRRLFATADMLATRYQTDSHYHLGRMILFAAIGGGALDLFHALHGMVHMNYGAVMASFTGLFLILFAAGSWLVIRYLTRTQKERHQDCHLAYCSLAESLRVQFFWKIFGLKRTVALHFQGRDFDELDWIRSAADIAWRLAGAQLGADSGTEYGSPAKRHRRAVWYWLEDQKDYFERAVETDLGWLHRHESAVGLCIRGALGMAALCALASGYSLCECELPEWLAEGMAAAVIINAIFLGLNIFCCGPLGTKKPKKGPPGTKPPGEYTFLSGMSWWHVRQRAEGWLKVFGELQEVPRWVPRETDEHRSERRRKFWHATMCLLLALEVMTVLVMFVAPRLPEDRDTAIPAHSSISDAGHATAATPASHSTAACPAAGAALGKIAEETPGEPRSHQTQEGQHPEDHKSKHESPYAHFAMWVEFSAISSIGFLLLAAGLFHFRAYRHAYEAHVESYESSLAVFTEAHRRLNVNRSDPHLSGEQARVVLKFGEAALAENCGWAATHHSRPLEPPLG